MVSRERCACGRTSLRIDRIVGRCDDMLIVKGVNFFPKQVEQALMEIPGVLPEYFMALRWDGAPPQGEVAYHPAFTG